MVIRAGEAVQHGFLPGAKLLLQFSGFGRRVEEIRHLAHVGAEVEKFWLEAGVDDELVGVVEDSAGARIVLLGDSWVTEVQEVIPEALAPAVVEESPAPAPRKRRFF